MKSKNKFKETEIGMISEDWEVKRLGDEIELIYGKGLTENKRVSGEFPVYGSNGIVGFHNDYLVEGPGIIIGRKGSVGEVKFSKKNFWPIDTTYYVKIKRKGNVLFWYYFLQTLNLNKMNTHSAVPGLNREQVYEIVNGIPELKEQKAIAKILSDLDDKIELNQEMNKILEEIGQAIFKHCFIDFEFPNEEGKPYKSSGGKMEDSELGEIPKGWEIKPIDEIADFLNGLALQKYPPENEEEYLPVIKIRELRQGITESTDKASVNIPKEYIIDDCDIIFSWSGSLEVVIWGLGKGALNQHLFKVTSKKYPQWLYYYWITKYLPQYRHIAKGKATTMGHIQRHHLKSSLVIVPDEKALMRMNKVLCPIIDKIVKNKIETKNLSQIRDVLLPKLMSGKIRVNTI